MVCTMSESSNYPEDEGLWIYGDPRSNSLKEVRCTACHGSGEDRYTESDCIECEGYGSIPLAN